MKPTKLTGLQPLPCIGGSKGPQFAQLIEKLRVPGNPSQLEGYGLQPVHLLRRISGALAPEGRSISGIAVRLRREDIETHTPEHRRKILVIEGKHVEVTEVYRTSRHDLIRRIEG